LPKKRITKEQFQEYKYLLEKAYPARSEKGAAGKLEERAAVNIELLKVVVDHLQLSPDYTREQLNEKID